MLVDEEKKETVRKHFNIRGHHRHDMNWKLGRWLGEKMKQHASLASRGLRHQLGIIACGPVAKQLSGRAVFFIPMVGLCKE